MRNFTECCGGPHGRCGTDPAGDVRGRGPRAPEPLYLAWFSPVVPLERKAVRIHGWEPFVVPGLLQTEKYARELMRRIRKTT